MGDGMKLPGRAYIEETCPQERGWAAVAGKKRKKKKPAGEAGRCLAVSLLLMGLLFLLPVMTGLGAGETSGAEQEPEPLTLLPPGETDGAETLRVLTGETVEEMTLGEYLTGVLRAEMPASFHQQALCAQAVAARTYTRYQLSGGSRHGDTADICTDHTCCQAFMTAEAAAAGWGAEAERNEARVANAVAETDGQTIFYGGEPILAVFHSSSAGRTKAAGSVWAEDLPYLRSVESPEGEDVPNYYSRVDFTPQEFRELLLAAAPSADLSGPCGDWIGETVRADGGVETITIGGVTLRGSRVRSIFGLRSATFDAEAGPEGVSFYVTGYGHGVGLSQYGAQTMALEGRTWREIIAHYYTGVTVEPWPGGA